MRALKRPIFEPFKSISHLLPFQRLRYQCVGNSRDRHLR
jgi:hypothetical protein